jgi:hypothetical protein
MTLKQIQTISDPAEGLMVYCTNCSTIGVFVNNGTKFINIVNGNSMDIDFDTTTDVVDVTSTTGERWMDRNLGAARAATSSTDETSYGDLYQWGRAKDGHESRKSGTTGTKAESSYAGHDEFITASGSSDHYWTTFSGAVTLWQSGLNDPCPVGYRIPTEAELDDERANFSPQNAAGAYASVLKLPVAGARLFVTAVITNDGSTGYYWSSTVDSGTTTYVRVLNLNTNNKFYSYANAHGFSVRCIKKE